MKTHPCGARLATAIDPRCNSAIPIAIVINGVRVFLTGFLVLFVSPEMGEGFMHTSEGMLMFGAAFFFTAIVAWLLSKGEGLVLRSTTKTGVA